MFGGLRSALVVLVIDPVFRSKRRQGGYTLGSKGICFLKSVRYLFAGRKARDGSFGRPHGDEFFSIKVWATAEALRRPAWDKSPEFFFLFKIVRCRIRKSAPPSFFLCRGRVGGGLRRKHLDLIARRVHDRADRGWDIYFGSASARLQKLKKKRETSGSFD